VKSEPANLHRGLAPQAGVALETPSVRIQRFGLAQRLAAAGGALVSVGTAAVLVYASLPVRDGSFRALSNGLSLMGLGFGLVGIWTLAVAAAAWGWARLARARPGALAVTDAGITVFSGDHDHALIPHDAVAAGWISSWGELSIRLTSGDVITLVVTTDEVDAVLDAIAQGPSDSVVSLPLRRADMTTRVLGAIAALPVVALLLYFAAVIKSVPAVVGLAAALGIGWVYFLIAAGAARRVVVGRDGVALEGDHFQRVVPYARVRRVTPAAAGVRLELDDGTFLPITIVQPADQGRRSERLGALRRDRLTARIQQLAAQQEGAEPIGASLLDRRGRSIAAWREALQDLVTRPVAGYRAPALELDHVARVLEASAADPERRLGAALALSSARDPETLRRVRVVIDTCADDDLRAAIEEASHGELEESTLTRTLARLARAHRAPATSERAAGTR
jgi:hypothetical protein